MSDLLRQSVDKKTSGDAIRPPPRPRPQQHQPSIPEDPASDSSSSSADSEASIRTIRAETAKSQPSAASWSQCFEQELYLFDDNATYHAYLTVPEDLSKGPLFIAHHGAGSSGLSFAAMSQQLRKAIPSAGILSLEARGHGNTVVKEGDAESHDFALTNLVDDAERAIALVVKKMDWQSLPPSILVGHSLGGPIVVTLASRAADSSAPASALFGRNLVGYSVLDVVEGSAIEALAHMQTYLLSRPAKFSSSDDAVQWHLRTRTIRDETSAQISVPSLLVPDETGDLTWRTDLSSTSLYWPEWFGGLSGNFLRTRGAKQLILAGTDRLDKELMIGQMQGKFQLVVIPEAGHFVQEDAAAKVAQSLTEFWQRNDRSNFTLPPKVGDLLAKGIKV